MRHVGEIVSAFADAIGGAAMMSVFFIAMHGLGAWVLR